MLQTLVHSVLAEQLNSGSWLHRAVSCRMLCYLRAHASHVNAVFFDIDELIFALTILFL